MEIESAIASRTEVNEHHWLRHGITINDAVVKDANLECANGVIHIIDTVLMPKQTSI
jgi:uncharacterized surface protein with fasciclin (FAS1) repeats